MGCTIHVDRAGVTSERNFLQLNMSLHTSFCDSSEHEDKVANISVVNYQKLLLKDPAEANILLHSCIESGFFYLDLGSINMKGYLELKNSLFDVAKGYFSRPLEEKLKDFRDEMVVSNICG